MYGNLVYTWPHAINLHGPSLYAILLRFQMLIEEIPLLLREIFRIEIRYIQPTAVFRV